MKKLNEMIKTEEGTFPVMGVNGYAGEIDGSIPLFALLYVPHKKINEIAVPEHFSLQWSKEHKNQYEVSVGSWSNQCTKTEWENLFATLIILGGSYEFDIGQYAAIPYKIKNTGFAGMTIAI